jgi:hypothetical protein
MLTRRSFLPLLAAPAILKLGIHMPISSAKLVVPVASIRDGVIYWGDERLAWIPGGQIIGDTKNITRDADGTFRISYMTFVPPISSS